MATTENQLFSGRGKAKFRKHLAGGLKGKWFWIGNATAAALTPSVSKSEHKEMYSGKDAVDDVMYGDSKCAISLTVENYKLEILAELFQGAVTASVGATVTAEVLPEDLVAGEYLNLARPNISALTIVDSSAQPVTLEIGKHYVIDGAAFGAIQILDMAGLVEPLKADYTAGTVSSFNLMSEGAATYDVRIEGLNKSKTGLPMLIEAEAVFEPGKVLQVFGEGYQSVEFAGDVMFRNGDFGKVSAMGAIA